MKLNWHEIFWTYNASLTDILEKHKAVFEPGLGTISGYKAKILVDPDATPQYFKPTVYHIFTGRKLKKN